MKALTLTDREINLLERIRKTGILFVDEKDAQQGKFDKIPFDQITSNIWKNYEPNVVDTTYEEVKPEQLSDGR